MLSTTLLIVLGLVIAGVCILGLNASMERRMYRETRAHDGLDRERTEALRQISRDIEKGKSPYFGDWGGS